MTIPPPRDEALPMLEHVFDPGVMIPMLESTLAPDNGTRLIGYYPRYVRYKPGTSCLVQFDLDYEQIDGPRDSVNAQVKLFADDRAHRRAGSSRLRKQLERADNALPTIPFRRSAFFEPLKALLQMFPVDYDLPALVRISDRQWISQQIGGILPKHFGPQTTDPEVLRYKPERKALFRYEFESESQLRLYGKAYDDDRGVRLANWTEMLIASGVATPNVIASLPERRFILHAEEVGIPLAELRGLPGYVDWMEPLDQALTSLQNVELRELHRHSLEHEVRALSETTRLLKHVVPELESRLDTVFTELSRRLTGLDEQWATSHGDFYDDQAIVSQRGLSLIDLDEIRLSHPGIDTGNMLAHLESGRFRGEPVAEAHARFRDQTLRKNPQWGMDIDVFEAAGLLKLAPGPFRRLEVDWPDGVDTILTAVESCLRRERRFESVACPEAMVDAGEQRIISDPLLPQLGQVFDIAVVNKQMATLGNEPVEIDSVELIRHKVGRRAIVRYGMTNGDTLFGKTFASNRGPKVHRIAQLITERRGFGGNVDLPAPVAFLPDLKMLLQRSVAGVPVESALSGGDVELVKRIALAIHRFHMSGLDLGRVHDLDKELSPLTTRTTEIVEHAPLLGTLAWTTHHRLFDLPRDGFRLRNLPIHRDFYHDQVLIEGDRLAVLDLDDAAMSEPAIDIANFAAHLRLAGFQKPETAQRLIEIGDVFLACAQSLDRDLDQALLRFLTAATYLRLAGIHVSRPDGERVAGCLLRAATRSME